MNNSSEFVKVKNMEQGLLDKILDLKKALDNEDIVKKLNDIELKMENDDIVKAHAYRLDCACIQYSDALKIYDIDNPILKTYHDKINQAKIELDGLNIVRQYYESFRQVRKLYDEINSIDFKDLNLSIGKKE